MMPARSTTFDNYSRMISARMLGRVLAGFTWLLLYAGLAALSVVAPATARAGTIKVGDNEMGRNIQMGLSDTLEITLDSPSNPAYSWQVFQYNSGIVKPVGSPNFVANKTQVGGGGETTIQFTPVSPGETSIDLRYLPQRASSTTAPAKVFSISVTVRGQTT
jgi:predicted secreted protein